MKRLSIDDYSALDMRLPVRVRFALKDLWKRRMMTVFNLLAVFIAVVYLLVPSFYGVSIYDFQERVLDASLPTLVVASSPDVTDERMRFTRERIDELERLPEVRAVFPKVELGVKLSLDSRSSIDVSLEGTIPGDPSISAARLVWGRGVKPAEAHEVVMPKALFERMGGDS